jgi:hypothetical protein
MPIEIDTKALRSVSSMNEDKAGQIIDQTRKVVIGGKEPVDVKPVHKKITVEVPANLDVGVGPLVIVLVNKEGKTVAVLPYDREAKEFLKQEDEEDEEDE